MLAFLNTPTFPVFSPPTFFNPAFILRFYLSFIFYLAFIYCVLLFTNIIYHVMRTDTCNKPHTLRDAVTGRNRNRKYVTMRITFNIPEFTRNERNAHCDVLHITPVRVARLVLDDAIAAI